MNLQIANMHCSICRTAWLKRSSDDPEETRFARRVREATEDVNRDSVDRAGRYSQYQLRWLCKKIEKVLESGPIFDLKLCIAESVTAIKASTMNLS